ncbi:hypothetical protein Barb6XT_01173 [Bacteroidales bacterium Barb6XT]|nr:hypothetical protein Barb6XT_01173 [Bacteroidales bacterium Barb6XT]
MGTSLTVSPVTPHPPHSATLHVGLKFLALSGHLCNINN